MPKGRKSSVSRKSVSRKSESRKSVSRKSQGGRKSEARKSQGGRKSVGRKSESRKSKLKGRKSESRKSTAVESEVAAKELVLEEPEQRSLVIHDSNDVCNDKIQPRDPCRYTATACCKEEIACRPNHYPGLLETPAKLAVAGSESGTYDSLCKLLRAGMRFAERVLALTPWGNYVVFRCHSDANKIFFLFDGCTCNANRFRYWDLNCGTAGLLFFENLHELLMYILESREMRTRWKRIPKVPIDEMCAGIDKCALAC